MRNLSDSHTLRSAPPAFVLGENIASAPFSERHPIVKMKKMHSSQIFVSEPLNTAATQKEKDTILAENRDNKAQLSPGSPGGRRLPCKEKSVLKFKSRPCNPV